MRKPCGGNTRNSKDPNPCTMRKEVRERERGKEKEWRKKGRKKERKE